MLRDILLHFGEVLHVKEVLSETIKQNKVVNLLGHCRAVATLLNLSLSDLRIIIFKIKRILPKRHAKCETSSILLKQGEL